jgi:hypothetical protein
MQTRLKILLCGMLAGDPWQGGATWAVLQYALGLRRLGHDVMVVEPVDAPTEGSIDNSESATYFRQVATEFGLTDHSALLIRGSRQTIGVPYELVRAFAARANLLINIAGMLTDEELISPIQTRVYLDLDPGFTQLWQTAQGIDMRFGGHTHFVTIGTRIGRADCSIPTCDRVWVTTLQPVVLDEWSVVPGATHGPWTTIGNWRSYGSLTHEGVVYGQKAHSVRQFIDLPRRCSERFVLAMAIDAAETKDLAALAANDWYLVDPRGVAGSPQAYRRFVQTSKAEIGFAKSGYVAARCGWFSDRSICYLASSRPVLAQDTAFAPDLPVGEGLLSFMTIDEAVAGVELINANYQSHAKAARALAETYFESGKVLSRLLEAVGGSP